MNCAQGSRELADEDETGRRPSRVRSMISPHSPPYALPLIDLLDSLAFVRGLGRLARSAG